MAKISALLSLLAASAAPVSAYNAKASLSGAATKIEKSDVAAATAGRRDFLTSAATTAASLAFGLPAAASLVANPQPANAGAASDLTDVYFGVGCFWHIQVCFALFWAIDLISSALLFVCVVLASVFFVLSRPFIVISYCERILIKNPTMFISLYAARIRRGRAEVVGPW